MASAFNVAHIAEGGRGKMENASHLQRHNVRVEMGHASVEEEQVTLIGVGQQGEGDGRHGKTSG
jgi:hypothetical protein